MEKESYVPNQASKVKGESAKVDTPTYYTQSFDMLLLMLRRLILVAAGISVTESIFVMRTS